MLLISTTTMPFINLYSSSQSHAMYTFIMIFLMVVGSFSGVHFLSASATGNWLKQQDLKANHAIPAPAALPKGGMYSVSVEDYYLIH
jgi:hypothetical protein